MTQHQKALSVKEIRCLEAKAKALGLDERLLIENASSNMAQAVVKLALGRKAFVVAGKGNNGADSLACARKLLAKGYYITAVLVSEDGFSDEVIFQKEVLGALGVSCFRIDNRNSGELTRRIARCDFVIDGLLGIGIKGEINPLLKDVIARINSSGKTVVSCDIPSGLSPDEGTVLGEAIRADHTITFLAHKKGFFTRVGRALCGKVLLVDIGVSAQLLERSSAAQRLPRRKVNV
jgi:ADP-dependent NAD(P)H-hydrate dehydratase / NAD(P)H-hydrate epimerase